MADEHFSVCRGLVLMTILLNFVLKCRTILYGEIENCVTIEIWSAGYDPQAFSEVSRILQEIRFLQWVPITLGPGPATQRPLCFYRLQLPSMGASIALLWHGKLWVRISSATKILTCFLQVRNLIADEYPNPNIPCHRHEGYPLHLSALCHY